LGGWIAESINTLRSLCHVTASLDGADAAAFPTRERIPALDVLRGVAVAGILLANVLVFFG